MVANFEAWEEKEKIELTDVKISTKKEPYLIFVVTGNFLPFEFSLFVYNFFVLSSSVDDLILSLYPPTDHQLVDKNVSNFLNHKKMNFPLSRIHLQSQTQICLYFTIKSFSLRKLIWDSDLFSPCIHLMQASLLKGILEKFIQSMRYVSNFIYAFSCSSFCIALVHIILVLFIG